MLRMYLIPSIHRSIFFEICMFTEPLAFFPSNPRCISGTRIFFLLLKQLRFGDSRTRSKIGLSPTAKAETCTYDRKKRKSHKYSGEIIIAYHSIFFLVWQLHYRSCGRLAAIILICRLQQYGGAEDEAVSIMNKNV